MVGAVVLTIVRWKSAPAKPGTRAKLKLDLPLRHALIYGAAAVFAVASIVIAVISSDNQAQPAIPSCGCAGKNAAIASLGVENQQGGTVAYRLQLLKKGKVSNTWNLTLTNGQTWQLDIPYTSKYSLAANLYRLPNLNDPYRSVGNNQS